jgi:hypothetical protein
MNERLPPAAPDLASSAVESLTSLARKKLDLPIVK